MCCVCAFVFIVAWLFVLVVLLVFMFPCVLLLSVCVRFELFGCCVVFVCVVLLCFVCCLMCCLCVFCVLFV